jgi:hypothetical protein
MSADTTDFSELIGPESPFENYAEVHVSEDYEGPCALTCSDLNGQHWAIFHSREEAINAAIGACRYDIGGYWDVHVYPIDAAPPNTLTYPDVGDWLFGENDYKDEESEDTGVLTIIRMFMRELARRIAISPKELSNIEWRDLERLLFEVFDSLGFEAELTRSAKDGGYDIRLTVDSFVYLVELKHWSENSKAGKGFVDCFTEVVVSEGASGLLISTSGFTKQVIKARSTISTQPVVLGSSLKVISLCRHYVQNENGVWTRDGGLREILFDNTF